jgi:hypothetical protein
MVARPIDEELATDATEKLYDALRYLQADAVSPEHVKLARNHLYDGMLLLSRANVPTPIDIGPRKARRKEHG